MDTMHSTSRADEGAPRAGRAGERPLTLLFSDLWRETSQLLRSEVELAKAEMNEKASKLGSSVAAVAAGGAVLFAGLIVTLFAAVAGLARVLPAEHADWLAPLIVGAVVMLVGYFVLAVGRRGLRAENLAPKYTIASIRRDADMAKEHVR